LRISELTGAALPLPEHLRQANPAWPFSIYVNIHMYKNDFSIHIQANMYRKLLFIYTSRMGHLMYRITPLEQLAVKDCHQDLQGIHSADKKSFG
jgi:hypothetical protein